MGGNKQGMEVHAHTQVPVCNGGSCHLTSRQAASSPLCPLLAATSCPDPSPISPSSSSPGRMQVQGLLLLLALILLAATAEAGKNKKGESGAGEQPRVCSCVPEMSTCSPFPCRESEEGRL